MFLWHFFVVGAIVASVIFVFIAFLAEDE